MWMKQFFKKYRHIFFGGDQIVERDKIVYNWLKNLPSKTKLLDAGAGIQRYKPMCSHLEYFSQDFGNYCGGDEFAGEVVRDWDSTKCDIISDITNIPLPDNSVDNILCTEVFEHLSNPSDALGEFSRLLKNDGCILITAPFNSQYHQTPYYYYSGFSSEFYKFYGDKFGLEITNIEAIGDYYQSISQELFRLPFLKMNIVAKLLILMLVCPAVIACFLLHKFKIKSPIAPFAYGVYFKKKSK